MLVLVSKPHDFSPEEIAFDYSFEARTTPENLTSAWFGHPLVLRGVLRDGTQVSLALNMTECAQIFLSMQADDALRDWADTMQAMHAGILSS